ncbi:RNA polymerase sigma factor [Cohnella terricola]|uniref:RNA polymerase sigma factor n=1 Tax=Cohnella terricola TaxID=1289167 RepID=UPI0016485A5B|nr:RNA polymerase sigma factor [Cohnella terricola]
MPDELLYLQHQNFANLSPDLQKEIYRTFYNMYYPTIYYMVNNHSTTEDIIQESFLKVIYRMPGTGSLDKTKAWIKTVVKNTTLNFLRKNKKDLNNVDLEHVFNSEHECVTDSEGVAEKIEFKELIQAVEHCLHDLKPEYRILIELRWRRELSYKEIADELNITEHKVKYTLNRAREAIKRRLAKEGGYKYEGEAF